MYYNLLSIPVHNYSINYAFPIALHQLDVLIKSALKPLTEKFRCNSIVLTTIQCVGVMTILLVTDGTQTKNI